MGHDLTPQQRIMRAVQVKWAKTGNNITLKLDLIPSSAEKSTLAVVHAVTNETSSTFHKSLKISGERTGRKKYLVPTCKTTNRIPLGICCITPAWENLFLTYLPKYARRKPVYWVTSSWEAFAGHFMQTVTKPY